MQIISDLLNNVEKDTIIIYLSTKVIYLTIIGLFNKLKVYSNSFKYGGLVGLKYLSKSKESKKILKLGRKIVLKIDSMEVWERHSEKWTEPQKNLLKNSKNK